jgi:hypothetical protein
VAALKKIRHSRKISHENFSKLLKKTILVITGKRENFHHYKFGFLRTDTPWWVSLKNDLIEIIFEEK